MEQTTLKQCDDLLQAQSSYFASGQTRALDARLEALARFEEVLREREEEVLAAVAQDLGKPTLEAFLSEYYFVLQELRLVQKSLRRWLRPRRAGSPIYFWPCRNEVRREPYGQVLIISPWNYPIQLALAPVIGAIAAGNTVLLKPSEETPTCAALLAEILSAVFPPDWVAVVQGDGPFTTQLLERRFDFLFFTGSTQIGHKVAQQAASHLTPHILELGGKCPCVVDRTADLKITAKRILIGKLFNAGQTCFAPDFVAVEESVCEELVAALVEVLRELPWEDEMARIINDRHFQRLQALLSEEAKVTFKKGEDQMADCQFAPRILGKADWDDVVMKEEIFGPLLPVVCYRDLADLTTRLKKFSEPLALYCFSREEAFVAELTSRIPSGGVCVNDVGKQATNLHLPFGGKGSSGHGRYRGRYSVNAFSYERAYTRRYFVKDPFESLPPRHRQNATLRKWMK